MEESVIAAVRAKRSEGLKRAQPVNSEFLLRARSKKNVADA
jgi:hypothetical protein